MPFSKVTLPQTTDEQLQAFVNTFDGGAAKGVILFYGSSDYNRNKTLDLVSKYYLCSGTKDNSCPCPSCRLEGEHPDIFELEPSKSGNILVGSIKDSLEFLENYSVISQQRCLIIRQADKLTEYAEDCLLKVLEEGYDDVLVLLSCRSKKSVPKTIMSRSKLVFTGDASRRTYSSILAREGNMRPKKAEELSRISTFISVDPLLGLELVEEAYKVSPVILTHMLNGDAYKALKSFNGFASKGANNKGLRVLAEIINANATDFLKAKLGAPASISLTGRTEWYLDKVGNTCEKDLNRVCNALRRPVLCEERQVKALFIWAIGIVSEIIKESKKKEEV